MQRMQDGRISLASARSAWARVATRKTPLRLLISWATNSTNSRRTWTNCRRSTGQWSNLRTRRRRWACPGCGQAGGQGDKLGDIPGDGLGGRPRYRCAAGKENRYLDVRFTSPPEDRRGGRHRYRSGSRSQHQGTCRGGATAAVRHGPPWQHRSLERQPHPPQTQRTSPRVFRPLPRGKVANPVCKNHAEVRGERQEKAAMLPAIQSLLETVYKNRELERRASMAERQLFITFE